MDAILFNFIEEAITSGARAKALAVMSILIRKGGGYNCPTDLTANNIAELLNASNSSLTDAILMLEKSGMIRRDQTSGRGNRLVITPLSPDHWKLPDGRKFKYEAKAETHVLNPDIASKDTHTTHFPVKNIEKHGVYQEKWAPIFKKIQKHIDSQQNITAYEPFRLYAVMAMIADHSAGPNEPSSLNSQELSKKLKSNIASMTRALQQLEGLGVIKRHRAQHSKIITPIIPTD